MARTKNIPEQKTEQRETMDPTGQAPAQKKRIPIIIRRDRVRERQRNY